MSQIIDRLTFAPVHPAYGEGEILFTRDGWAYCRFPHPPGRADRKDGVIPYAWVKLPESSH